jgi:hypothetical protein
MDITIHIHPVVALGELIVLTIGLGFYAKLWRQA